MIRKLGPSEWRDFICEELWPIIDWLAKRQNIHIKEVILDIKGVYTDVYVDGPLTPEVAAAAVADFEPNGRVRVGDGWLSCPEHYCSIQGADAYEDVSRGTSFSALLKSLFD